MYPTNAINFARHLGPVPKRKYAGSYCFMTNLMPTIPHSNNELTLCLAIACSTTGEPPNGTVLYTRH